jgi:hypothetical protein
MLSSLGHIEQAATHVGQVRNRVDGRNVESGDWL